jgi:hypothetical protein
VSRTEYFDLLEAAAHYVEYLRAVRGDSSGLDAAPDIIKEMQFCGMFNHKFREETAPEVETLLDDMYIELNA